MTRINKRFRGSCQNLAEIIELNFTRLNGHQRTTIILKDVSRGKGEKGKSSLLCVSYSKVVIIQLKNVRPMVRSFWSPLSICAPFYGYSIANQTHKEMKEVETRSFLRRRSRTNKVLNCLTAVEKGVGVK